MRKTSLLNMTNEIDAIEVSYNLLIYIDQPFEILVSTIATNNTLITLTSILWLDEEALQTPWSFAYEMVMKWGLETSFLTTVIDCQRQIELTYSPKISSSIHK